jgi:hypothetical protein
MKDLRCIEGYGDHARPRRANGRTTGRGDSPGRRGPRRGRPGGRLSAPPLGAHSTHLRVHHGLGVGGGGGAGGGLLLLDLGDPAVPPPGGVAARVAGVARDRLAAEGDDGDGTAPAGALGRGDAGGQEGEVREDAGLDVEVAGVAGTDASRLAIDPPGTRPHGLHRGERPSTPDATGGRGHGERRRGDNLSGARQSGEAAMTSPITIHHLGPQDLERLCAVPEGLFDHPVDPGLAAAFLADPLHELVLAYEGELAVAFASGTVLLHPDKPPSMFVNEVATPGQPPPPRPRHRGHRGPLRGGPRPGLRGDLARHRARQHPRPRPSIASWAATSSPSWASGGTAPWIPSSAQGQAGPTRPAAVKSSCAASHRRA